MTKQQIAQLIIDNLRETEGVPPEVRVQKDPFGGWRIYVISDQFNDLDPSQRRARALANIPLNLISWADLVTNAEKEWVEELPVTDDDFLLPQWSDALAKANMELSAAAPSVQQRVFPSDIDMDLPTPIIVTFYSVKGGVGRSTSLGYCARLLASTGRKVICVDLDLEAPGLAALFGVEDSVKESQGVVNLLVALDRGAAPDFAAHLIRVSETDELYCVPAGRPSPEYARLLRFITPTAWYTEERNPLRELIEGLTVKLPFRPDVILLDSRTGISEISAPLLFDLADLAVIVFFPHPQAELPTGEVVRALLAAHSRRSVEGIKLTPEPRFVVSPIPSSRIPEVVNRYRNRAREWVSRWLQSGNQQAEQSLEANQETMHFIPYREDIATADTISPNSDTWREFEPVADWIERFLPSLATTESPLLQATKDNVLQELSFSSGNAEQQEAFSESFVETGSMLKALSPDIPLVLGRKGVGKTAVFRRLLEQTSQKAIPITAPPQLSASRPWILNANAFEAVDQILTERQSSWRQFWTILICVACHYHEPERSRRAKPPSEIDVALPATIEEALDVVRLLGAILLLPQAGLLADAWLNAIERETATLTFLLFDALESGFGNADNERIRRRQAIEGLCSLLIQRPEAKNLRLKILLRVDLWRQLEIDNKSHLYGRYITLEWKDQATFYKVVLKQAIRSLSFRETLTHRDRAIAETPPDVWSESQVEEAWNLLVGERMKGGKAAFTWRWVWNRLADANGDHSPRYLLQLFAESTWREKAEHRKLPDDRSIIRPRFLIESLAEVSNQALAAVQEEFPELAPLLHRLREIGRSPVDSSELELQHEHLQLAKEVGLIGAYEEADDRILRYKIPEIYRHALAMTRRGQA